MSTRPIINKFPVTLGFNARYPWSWKYRYNSPLRYLAGVKHKGTDFGCTVGTKVRAPINIRIKSIHNTPYSVYGRHIWAWSEDGSVRLLFAHLDVIATANRSGKEWHESQVFCWSGNTGRYTSGPHLHMGAQRIVKGKWVWIDPLEIYG